MVPGTLTQRLAGTGGINAQQTPVSEGYRRCWKPREGHVFIDTDFSSLEQIVLAELSQDPTLMKLYGPNAAANDVYLFNGSHMIGLDKAIRKHYDPDNPTKESIQDARHYCKKERSISKVITLASSYGAGVGKLYETLKLQGIKITFDEVEAMRDSYWELYAGVREYGYQLEKEWKDRQGWVYNGFARPMPVAPHLTKDLVNRVVQSTGHDCLMLFIYYLNQLRIQQRVGMWPIIVDFHDESLWECKVEDKDKVVELFKKAYELTNKELDGIIVLDGDVKVANDLWECK